MNPSHEVYTSFAATHYLSSQAWHLHKHGATKVTQEEWGRLVPNVRCGEGGNVHTASLQSKLPQMFLMSPHSPAERGKEEHLTQHLRSF